MKRIKKVILLAFAIFILTGCSASYNVEISDDNFTEYVTISELNQANLNKVSQYSLTLREMIDHQFSSHTETNIDSALHGSSNPDIKYDGVSYYTKGRLPSGSGYGVYATHVFPSLDLYRNSNIAASNADFYKVIVDGDIISVMASSFNAFEKYEFLDDITINITVNHYVRKHNADKVVGNVYTWKITKDTANTKTINLSYSKSAPVKVDKKEEKPDNTENYILLLILFGVGGLSGLGYYLFMKKMSSNNS